MIRVMGRLLGKTEDQVRAEFDREERRDDADEARDLAQAKAVADVLSAVDNLPENAELEQKDELIEQLRRRVSGLREELAAAGAPPEG